MKIVTIIGARPQFIKAAAVSKVLSSKKDIIEVLVHTGQHFDSNMSDVFFDELGIPKPSYNLGIGGGTHGAMTGAQLIEIEKVLLEEKPDWVLVYGDTNSTLAGALAAVKLHIPVAHVEAGLRSYNRAMPEEINRILTDHISTLLFAPTGFAMENLSSEGVKPHRCHLVGDVMLDAARLFGDLASTTSTILHSLGLKNRKYVLATVHRAENTDDLDRFGVIMSSLNTVSNTLPVVWPMHPRTRKLIDMNALSYNLGTNLLLVEPVGYLDMLMLEKNAALIATDSGGVQKEAFFCEVPCVTLRDETEWIELVESGWNRLSPPTDAKEVVSDMLGALGTKGQAFQPYGDGDTANRIASIIYNYSDK